MRSAASVPLPMLALPRLPLRNTTPGGSLDLQVQRSVWFGIMRCPLSLPGVGDNRPRLVGICCNVFDEVFWYFNASASPTYGSWLLRSRPESIYPLRQDPDADLS